MRGAKQRRFIEFNFSSVRTPALTPRSPGVPGEGEKTSTVVARIIISAIVAIVVGAVARRAAAAVIVSVLVHGAHGSDYPVADAVIAEVILLLVAQGEDLAGGFEA